MEKVGEQSSSAQLHAGDRHLKLDERVDDHDAALRAAFDMLGEAGIDLRSCGLAAVRHRVVHGGKTFYRPTVIDDAVIAKLKDLSPLAPLHNPPAVSGIEVGRKIMPDIPHIAVFNTAFLSRLAAGGGDLRNRPRAARKMAHPPVRISRTSHRYASEQFAAFLGRPLAELNQIVACGERRVCLGDRERPARRHFDGADPDGGLGDGHPQR